MTKTSKIKASIWAGSLSLALTLSGISAQSASADGATLTYSEFMATPEYATLTAASANNASAVRNTLGMDVTMDVKTTVLKVKVISLRANIAVNQNTSWAQVIQLDANGNITQDKTDYYYGNSTYIQDLDTFQAGKDKVANLNDVLTRLGKPNANAVSSDKGTAPEAVGDIKPSAIFASVAEDQLDAKNGFDGTGMYFTNITVSHDFFGATTYSFQSQSAVGTSGDILNASYSETFNVSGLLANQSIDTSDTLGNVALSVATSIMAHNDIMVPCPQPYVTVDQKQLTTMGHKVEAEKLVTGKAISLAAVAKSLAKSTHSALAIKHLTLAAKTLSAKTTSVKNGVKLTAKSKGVSGSMCVTIAKGKTAVNHC